MTHAEQAVRRRKLAEAVKSGVPADTVAARAGVSYPLVRSACRAAGIGRQRHMSFREVLAILRDLMDGMGQLDAARKHDVWPHQVAHVVRESAKAGWRLPK